MGCAEIEIHVKTREPGHYVIVFVAVADAINKTVLPSAEKLLMYHSSVDPTSGVSVVGFDHV